MISFACRVLTEHITTYWRILRFIFTRVLGVLQRILWETHLFSLFTSSVQWDHHRELIHSYVWSVRIQIHSCSSCSLLYSLRSSFNFFILWFYALTHAHMHANKRILIHQLKWNLRAPTQQNENVWVRMHTQMYARDTETDEEWKRNGMLVFTSCVWAYSVYRFRVEFEWDIPTKSIPSGKVCSRDELKV